MKTRYAQIEWKKRNLRKVPKHVLRKISQTPGDLEIAVVKKIPQKHIEAGHYKHLGLVMENGKPVTGGAVVPRASQGRYSRMNKYGHNFVYKNRPKVLRTFSFEAPNWGDWSKGTHLVELVREVYKRDFVSPRLLRVHTEVLAQDFKGFEPRWLIKFSLDGVLSPSDPTFQKELRFGLNILQENVGTCDVFSSSATRMDFLKTVYLTWEILPPGERGVQIERILGANSNISLREKASFEERYDFIIAYKPSAIVLGTSGFVRYFGAKFSNDLVVFENVKYGNAVYVMFENWETISQRSRIDLLNQPSDQFVRIIHRPGWKAKLKSVLEKHLTQRRIFSDN